jgi:hypothetical protein
MEKSKSIMKMVMLPTEKEWNTAKIILPVLVVVTRKRIGLRNFPARGAEKFAIIAVNA